MFLQSSINSDIEFVLLFLYRINNRRFIICVPLTIRFKPEEIVFADDNESRLVGAKELGINTFVYEDFDSFVKSLKELGVEVF